LIAGPARWLGACRGSLSSVFAVFSPFYRPFVSDAVVVDFGSQIIVLQISPDNLDVTSVIPR
jgi:hypothetical protein